VSKQLDKFIKTGQTLIELDAIIQSQIAERDRYQADLSNALPELLPRILAKLGINAAALVRQLDRTHQALSNAIKDRNASVPMLIGIVQLLQGKQAKLPKTKRKNKA